MTDSPKYATINEAFGNELGWNCACGINIPGDARIEHVCGCEGVVAFKENGEESAAGYVPATTYDELLAEYREAMLQIVLLRTKVPREEWPVIAKEAINILREMKLGGDEEQ